MDQLFASWIFVERNSIDPRLSTKMNMKVSRFFGFFSRDQTESSKASMSFSPPVEVETTRRELQSPTGRGYPLMATWSWQTLFFIY